MQLVPVNNKKAAKEFRQVPIAVNRNNPHWIQSLDKDIEEVFDPGKNKTFRHGECQRWLLKDDPGHTIGRIAAFVNKKYKTKGDDVPVGGIGFFECINNQAAANYMFDFCRKWLAERGMQAMDGPINFGERDRWWGLLTEGFHEPPYCMNYNPPYYQALFENYGFKPFFNQLCFAINVDAKLQDKFYERHARIAQDKDFAARHLRKAEWKKFATDFCTVYNKAWAGHGGNKSLEPRQAIKLFEQLKPVIDEHLIWIAYYKEEPIGCWLNLPDLNQIFKRLHGKFGWIQKLKFLWLRSQGVCTRFTGLVFGIVPEFQSKGVDSYMIVEGARLIQSEMKYKDYEMQWIGDFNPKMINVAESLGTYCSRKLITYRYLFDRKKEFKRHPILL
jgi:hypothetical protein